VGALITLVIAIWCLVVAASWVMRHRARRRNDWLRSHVADDVAYARLRAEIARREDGTSA
jgi:cation transport regulator ChaB